MLNEQMSAQLRDELAADNAKRLVDPRSLPVRFSRLKHIARSPLHYLHAAQAADVDTVAKRVGRAAHAYALGGKVACWDQKTESGRARPRNGKDWDKFKADNAGAEIVNGKEGDEAKAIAAAVKAHPRAAELLYGPGTRRELEVTWKYMGRECVSHLDAYRPGVFVGDLKGLKDGNPEKVKRQAIWDHLHVQLAMYATAVEYIKDPTPDALLIVVEKPTKATVKELRLPVTVMPLTPRTLEAGRKMFHLWMEKLLACEKANEWPSYSLSDVEIDIPEADEPFSVLYQGDEFDL
jgi:hypothetical protein